MFEHVQQRNRRPVFVPIVIVAVIGIALYVVIDRWSRRNDSETFEAVSFDHGIPALLSRVELPGMSLELPGSPVRKGDYIAGTAQVGNTFVGWTPGLLIRDPAFQQKQFKSFGGGDRPPVETLLGGAFAYEDHPRGVHVLFGSCGRRTIILHADVQQEQFEVIKRSFTCKPDRELAHLGVAVGPLDKTWRRTDDDVQIKLESSTGQRLTVQSRREVRDPRGGMISADATMETQSIYTIWRGHGTSLAGKPVLTGFVRWHCPIQERYGEVVITGETSIDQGIELALTGYCIELDAPLPDDLRFR